MAFLDPAAQKGFKVIKRTKIRVDRDGQISVGQVIGHTATFADPKKVAVIKDMPDLCF